MYVSTFDMNLTSWTTYDMAESCTTATRLEVSARERTKSATGPRRRKDELKTGWRWVGNETVPFGLGCGEMKSGSGSS
ncbi:hypothetical protein HanRHA438_Chr10g0446921 [Helianthus annuus]|nr:hypothetical protein HanIR_Chr10g0468761 [Helianthus annuus]KAJ0879054.1 hypothetical protein HanRHA438_Chr10g0446921 [Helianthus annuus]